MTVRIRYKKVTENGNELLISNPYRTETSNVVKAQIKKVIEGGSISFVHSLLTLKANGSTDEGTWVPFETGTPTKNLTVVKNKVKAAMKANGVSFHEEIRRRSRE